MEVQLDTMKSILCKKYIDKLVTEQNLFWEGIIAKWSMRAYHPAARVQIPRPTSIFLQLKFKLYLLWDCEKNKIRCLDWFIFKKPNSTYFFIVVDEDVSVGDAVDATHDVVSSVVVAVSVLKDEAESEEKDEEGHEVEERQDQTKLWRHHHI